VSRTFGSEVTLVFYSAPWHRTDLKRVKIHRITMITIGRVMYLTDSPERTEFDCKIFFVLKFDTLYINVLICYAYILCMCACVYKMYIKTATALQHTLQRHAAHHSTW